MLGRLEELFAQYDDLPTYDIPDAPARNTRHNDKPPAPQQSLYDTCLSGSDTCADKESNLSTASRLFAAGIWMQLGYPEDKGGGTALVGLQQGLEQRDGARGSGAIAGRASLPIRSDRPAAREPLYPRRSASSAVTLGSRCVPCRETCGPARKENARKGNASMITHHASAVRHNASGAPAHSFGRLVSK